MEVIRFINSILTSNSYVLNLNEDKGIWVVDPGDSKPIVQWLIRNNKYLNGILITHSHFDHIYGINDLYDLYPTINIYASKYARDGMFSAKLNCSYYTDNPFVVQCNNINIVEDNDNILLSKNINTNVIDTPGHNRDCLSFQIEKNLFTGDAFIPGIKIFRKSKYSNKMQAENSIKKIFEQFDDDTMIWPGHENNCLLGELKHGKIDNKKKHIFSNYPLRGFYKLITI